MLRLALRLKNLFDRDAEEAGEAEGEGQARIVALGFDRIDRLPRDAEALGELGLGPVALGAEQAEAVGQASSLPALFPAPFPEYRRVPSQVPALQASIMTRAIAYPPSFGAPSISSCG